MQPVVHTIFGKVCSRGLRKCLSGLVIAACGTVWQLLYIWAMWEGISTFPRNKNAALLVRAQKDSLDHRRPEKNGS